ncbi:hypothetical protein [Spongiivirga citrea]|uniref:Uncharacterized protein n=1 Tax=Spongiivirga citrea TaxID=1481457 RepID=A0A6M0CHD6_9FLAO|nr:hypothetical protein [Spongiivirga citrea]NER17271.1 hypothetical protein [Spongiivirga citrea]
MSNHRKNRAKKHLDILLSDFMDVVDYLQNQNKSQRHKRAKSLLISYIADLNTHYPSLLRKVLEHKTLSGIQLKLEQLYYFHIQSLCTSNSFHCLIKLFIKGHDNMVAMIDLINDDQWDLHLKTTSTSYKYLTVEDIFCLLIPNDFESQCLEIIRIIETKNTTPN